MSALPSKPSSRHNVSEWLSNNQQSSDKARDERQVSHEVRQEGRALRNETNCKTAWDESDTSRRLSDRIWDVARWKDASEGCAQEVDAEMEASTSSKAQSESASAATSVPSEVTRECSTSREGRRGYESVLDPVEEQSRKEAELIEGVQQRSQQSIDRAFEQSCVSQEVRHQSTADLQDKTEASDIDMSCSSLTIKSPDISSKTNPTRIPSGSSSPQEWAQFSRSNVARAHEAVRVSQRMRADSGLSRAQLQNEMEAQRRATEFALRKRHHQEEQAKEESQWQIKNTEDEMAEMESDIRGSDADSQAKTASSKSAHTRSETRSRRPGVDSCRDQVQHGLVAEVQQSEATIQASKQKLSEAQNSSQKMKLHHSRMRQDLSRKQEASSSERRSIQTRSRVTDPSGSDRTAPPSVPLVNSSGRSSLQSSAR